MQCGQSCNSAKPREHHTSQYPLQPRVVRRTHDLAAINQRVPCSSTEVVKFRPLGKHSVGQWNAIFGNNKLIAFAGEGRSRTGACEFCLPKRMLEN